MQNSDAPPLIEAIFELRWGETKPGTFKFDNADRDVFFLKFSNEAFSKGFGEIQTINQDAPLIPHLLKHRFWQSLNSWPCLQAGLGIVTVNQTDDGYSWLKFEAAIKSMLVIFSRTDENRFARIKDSAKLRLTYQDFLPFNEGERDLSSFLKKTLNVEVTIPQQYDGDERVESLDELSIVLGHSITKPIGKMSIRIVQAINEGKGPGYLVETIVESSCSDAQIERVEDIHAWLDQAHLLQKHSYETLMKAEK